MFNSFFPDDYISSVYDIDFEKMYSSGYNLVLFDIDNTLVAHNAPADSRAESFFSELKRIGFKTAMLSNNGEPRVKTFCEAVGADGYEYKSGKPSTKAYLHAVEMYGTGIHNTIFIGDQIFTDILGAKHSGIRNIMVEPVLKWKEEPQIVLKRFLEAIVLFFYKRHVNKFGANNPVPLIKHI